MLLNANSCTNVKTHTLDFPWPACSVRPEPPWKVVLPPPWGRQTCRATRWTFLRLCQLETASWTLYRRCTAQKTTRSDEFQFHHTTPYISPRSLHPTLPFWPCLAACRHPGSIYPSRTEGRLQRHVGDRRSVLRAGTAISSTAALPRTTPASSTACSL